MNKQLPTAFSQQNAKKQQSRSSFFKPGSVYNAASSDSTSDVLGGHTRQFVSDSKFVSKFAFHDYNSGISPVCLPRTSFTVIVGQFICQFDREFVRQFVDQHSGFYSWSTFSSSPSVADDVGVLFENDRRQRERLYKVLVNSHETCCIKV
jgi:hypothetical protein